MICLRFVVVVVSLLLAGLCIESEAAKILGVFPFPSPSHLIVLNSLTNELVAKGHDVTIITPISQGAKAPKNNYREILSDIDRIKLMQGMGNVDMYSIGDQSLLQKNMKILKLGNALCENILSHENIQKLIHSSEEKFDLIIFEAFFSDCLLGFAHKFQAPFVQVCAFGGAEWMGSSVGNPHFYSYIADFNLNYNDKMTFIQRLHNTGAGLLSKFFRAVFFIPAQNSIMHKFFEGTGPVPLPHITELNQKTSLLLLNNHVSLTYAKPYMPNIIEVGGMHIKPPKKLPQDLQQFLDAATEGVVYFSMGSNLRGSDMPDAKRDALLQAFGQLKEKVLWKWEIDVLPGQPKNVKLGKWLPQSDLLAHPNVKLFITHGGLLSTQESMYHGVPIVGIPMFADQRMNMNQAVQSGYGRLLDYHDITNTSVLEAINDVLHTPKYRENAQRISKIFRDQPSSPLETGVFWTEYIIRHKGAYHMRSAALDLSWYQYYLLDVITLLAVAVGSILFVIYWITMALLRRVCSKKKITVKDNKKKN